MSVPEKGEPEGRALEYLQDAQRRRRQAMGLTIMCDKPSPHLHDKSCLGYQPSWSGVPSFGTQAIQQASDSEEAVQRMSAMWRGPAREVGYWKRIRYNRLDMLGALLTGAALVGLLFLLLFVGVVQ